MPIYTYTCPVCSATEDRVVSYEKRDDVLCSEPLRLQGFSDGTTVVDLCVGRMTREEISEPGLTKSDSTYTVQAVMSDGSRVPASGKRRWR